MFIIKYKIQKLFDRNFYDLCLHVQIMHDAYNTVMVDAYTQ